MEDKELYLLLDEEKEKVVFSSYDFKEVVNNLIVRLKGYCTDYYKEPLNDYNDFCNNFSEHEGLYFCYDIFTNGEEVKDYSILKTSYADNYQCEYVKKYLKSIDN